MVSSPGQGSCTAVFDWQGTGAPSPHNELPAAVEDGSASICQERHLPSREYAAHKPLQGIEGGMRAPESASFQGVERASSFTWYMCGALWCEEQELLMKCASEPTLLSF